jgi:hypothetical protein
MDSKKRKLKGREFIMGYVELDGYFKGYKYTVTKLSDKQMNFKVIDESGITHEETRSAIGPTWSRTDSDMAEVLMDDLIKELKRKVKKGGY